MTQYYVYVQWPSDRDKALPWQNVHLVAGPFDLAIAQRVLNEHQNWHRNSGTETDRDLNQMLGRGENNYTPTDTGQFFIMSVDDLRAKRATGAIHIHYRQFIPKYHAEILS